MRGFTGCRAFTGDAEVLAPCLTLAPVVEEQGECPSEAAATDEGFLGFWPSVQRYIRNGRSLELLPAARGSETLSGSV